MTENEKVLLLASAAQDATIHAFARRAYDIATRSSIEYGDDLFVQMCLLFADFNRRRNEEIAYLRSEVVRLRMLVTEPSSIYFTDGIVVKQED